MSPYKDKEAQKEANRDRMRKVRGNTSGNTTQGNTEKVTQDNVTQYPSIILALTDHRREKLEKVYQSLKDHKVETLVRYGCYGPTFDVVGELLEVTQ